jgi:hypothetical protein
MEIFFYGLFMDQKMLEDKGVHPINPRKGILNNYALKIGNRASLIPADNERVYGIVMTINDEEVLKLYADESVADYIPDKVEIVTETNVRIEAICYILPEEFLQGTNKEYAKKLYDLGKRLNLPHEYLNKIKRNFN